ncbi:carbohydrate ABC transporter permease [Xylanimonas protaetiae]|uniref:Carbohydrate ABC transporter permease n=1 Tax=Xylanimonas protaetiae TaxID=2509457 RepID=A0A4P6F1I8_9MICO|nr:carbohydrate ABC transporter permease [Xylanimonas protaetiae]QAY68985.1 carbohydrate ABC transporter permease [Xylanimonas protaetiae]
MTESVRPDIAGVRNSLTTVKDTRGTKVFRWFNYSFLTLLVVVTLYPFVNLIAMSFSSDGAIRAGRVNLWPVGFNTTTIRAVMGDPMFWINYRNTVFYTVLFTIIAMVITTCFAYVISRQHLPGRKLMIGMATFTMFFGGGLVPHFVVVGQWYGLRNTIWAVVLPGALSVFNLLVMKSFFENFPGELEEAASIDGLNTFGTFLRIVLPLSKALLATMTLFYAVTMWNAWFGSFLFLGDRNMHPVTMYLRNLIAGSLNTQEIADTADAAQVGANIQAVTMLLTVLPIMFVYPFVQKFFVSGVMLGSVKG